jgi:ubiquinone/menaquinone biosynthesis C-methylase UbiE
MTAQLPLQRLWSKTGEQLRHPQGAAGRLIGHLMASINWRPYQLAFDALEVRPTDHVLELGCGGGRSLGRLCDLASRGQVDAVDHSRAMIDMAARRNANRVSGGHLRLHTGPFSPLPFQSNTFDRLLAVNVLYFFDKEGRDIGECHRMLKPGGRLVVYVTDRSTMSNWPFCEQKTHRTFDETDLRALLVQSGFRNDRIYIDRAKLPLNISGLLAVAVKQAE